MKISKAVKLVGNVNRIDELVAAGAGASVISATFKEDGFNIGVQDMRALLKCIPILQSRSLPKSNVKKTIKTMAIVKTMINEAK